MKMSVGRVAAKHAPTHVGERVILKGHLHSVKDLGGLLFINIRDASGILQGVIEEEPILSIARTIRVETPIEVEGTVVAQSRADKYELRVERLAKFAGVSDTPPVELAKEKKIDALALTTLLDYRPITLRNPKVKAIFRLEAEITRAFREFLASEKFVEIHPPKIVATGTEGGAQLFKLDYFGSKAYLAQSPQFYKQIMVGVFERVFEVGPVYRAEEHDTTRHLNEYISLDFEMGFIESEHDIIAMQVRLLRHIFEHIRTHAADELSMYGAKVPNITDIPRIRLDEALRLLESKLGWRQAGQEDLDPEGERLLCEYFAREHGSELLYVTNYPLSARPFYTMPLTEPSLESDHEATTGASAGQLAHTSRLNEHQGSTGASSGQSVYTGRSDSTERAAPKTTTQLSRGFDLLFRGLEVTTGGQRIHEYDELTTSIRGRGLNPEDFSEYLQCFRYGMPPHGGLAIGLERLTKQLLGLPSVKQTSLFPRDINRLRP